MKVAIFPGSFDPIHQGHINVLKKASLIFDQIIFVVSNNPSKTYSSNLEQRCQKAKAYLQKNNHHEVMVVINKNMLTVDIAKYYNAHFIIRGLRNEMDWDYEKKLLDWNNKLNPNIETIFFMPDQKYRNTSSTQIRYFNPNNKLS